MDGIMAGATAPTRVDFQTLRRSGRELLAHARDCYLEALVFPLDLWQEVKFTLLPWDEGPDGGPTGRVCGLRVFLAANGDEAQALATSLQQDGVRAALVMR